MVVKKSLLIPFLITLGLIVFFLIQKDDYGKNNSYQNLYPKFKNIIDQIDKIEIETSKNSFYIIKKNNSWYLPSYNYYPADNFKIKNLLLNTAQLKVVDKKTNNPSYHNKLGLILPINEGSYRLRYLKNDDLLNDFIIGKKSIHKESLSYIRKLSEDQTWLFKDQFDLYDIEIEWAEDSILKIAKWRVKSINIKDIHSSTEEIFIFKDEYSDQMFKLKNMPKKSELVSGYILSNYASMLEDIKKVNILPFFDYEISNVMKKIIYKTFDGLLITINLIKVNDKLYAHFEVNSDIKIRKELSKDASSLLGLPVMKKFEDIKTEAQRYNYISDWLYEVNKDFNKEFLKNFSALVKQKENNQD